MPELDGTFTDAQLQRFQILRTRYAESHDHFTDRELARLSFLRWLIEIGSIETGPGCGDYADQLAVQVPGPTNGLGVFA